MPSIDDAVINSVLCYISTARHAYTEQTLQSVCLSFYSGDQLSEAKDVLFKTSGETLTHRRGESKSKADLQDIISLFRRLDEEGVILPKFLAETYRGMPPASGFEVLADHMVSLLSEMSELRHEISSIKQHRFNSDEIIEIKEELYDVKSLLMKSNNSSRSEQRSSEEKRSKTYAESLKDIQGRKKPPVKKLTENCEQIRVTADCRANGLSTSPVRTGASINDTNGRGYITDVVSTARSNHVLPQRTDDQENLQKWHPVRNRRKRDVIKGEKKVDGLFKSARQSVELYVGRCDKSVSINDIEKYIIDEIGVDVLSCRCISQETANMKSFRVNVGVEYKDKLLNPSEWPENICVRKYFFSRNNVQSR